LFYILSLHDALPIFYSINVVFQFKWYSMSGACVLTEGVSDVTVGLKYRYTIVLVIKLVVVNVKISVTFKIFVESSLDLFSAIQRSEEHTSELQSPDH